MLFEELLTIFTSDTRDYERGKKKVDAGNAETANNSKRLATEIKRAFSDGLTRELEAGLGNVTGKFGAASGAVSAFLGPVGLAVGGAAALAGGLSALTATAFQFAEKYADAAKEVELANAQTGISVEILSALRSPLRAAGTDLKNLSEGYTQLATNALAAASSQQKAAAFAREFGVTTSEVLKSPDVAIRKIFERLQSIPQPAARAALASRLFGEEAGRALTTVAGGVGNLDQFTEKMRRLGVVFDSDGVKAAKTFRAEIREMNLQLDGLQYTVGRNVLPVFNELLGVLNQASQRPGTTFAALIADAADAARGGVFGLRLGALSQVGQAANKAAGEAFDPEQAARANAEAEKMADRAKRLADIIGGLQNQVKFYGDKSNYAATQQRLLELGVNAVTDAAGRQALALAGLLDQLDREAGMIRKAGDEQLAAYEKRTAILKGYTEQAQSLKDATLAQTGDGAGGRSILGTFSRDLEGVAKGIKHGENLVRLLAALRAGQREGVADSQEFVDYINGLAASLVSAEQRDAATKAQDLGAAFFQMARDFARGQSLLASGAAQTDLEKFFDSIVSQAEKGGGQRLNELRGQLAQLAAALAEFKRLGGDMGSIPLGDTNADQTDTPLNRLTATIQNRRASIIANLEASGANIRGMGDKFGVELVNGISSAIDAGQAQVAASFSRLQDGIAQSLIDTTGHTQRARLETELLTDAYRNLSPAQREALRNQADQADAAQNFKTLQEQLTGELRKGAEATATQRIETALASQAYSNIAPALQDYLRGLAAQVDASHAAEEAQRRQTALAQRFEGVLTSTFENARRGGFRAVLQGWLDDFSRFLQELVARAVATNLAKYILGDAGGAGSGGGWLSKLLGIGANFLGAAFGGGINSNIAGFTSKLPGAGAVIPGFAMGSVAKGPAQGLAMVGERGPELAYFPQPAHIFNNAETRALLSGNDNSKTQNFYISLPPQSAGGYRQPMSARETAQQLVRALRFANA